MKKEVSSEIFIDPIYIYSPFLITTTMYVVTTAAFIHLFFFPKRKTKTLFLLFFFYIKKCNIGAQNAHSKNNNNLRILYEYTKKNSRYKNDYNLFYTFQQHIPLNFTVVYFSTITCYYINTMVYGIYYSALKIRKKVVE